MAVKTGHFKNRKGEIENEKMADEGNSQLTVEERIRNEYPEKGHQADRGGCHETPYKNSRFFSVGTHDEKMAGEIGDGEKAVDAPGKRMRMVRSCIRIPGEKRCRCQGKENCVEKEVTDGAVHCAKVGRKRNLCLNKNNPGFCGLHGLFFAAVLRGGTQMPQIFCHGFRGLHGFLPLFEPRYSAG